MVFTVMQVLDAVYYGMRMYSRVPDLGLCLSLNDVLGGELGRCFCLHSTLLGSTRRFGTEEPLRGSWHTAG